MRDNIWFGVVMYEHAQAHICAKYDASWKIVGFYGKCLIHGTVADINARNAETYTEPGQFCRECQAGKPQRNWQKRSEYAQRFMSAIESGSPDRVIALDSKGAVSFVAGPLKPCLN